MGRPAGAKGIGTIGDGQGSRWGGDGAWKPETEENGKTRSTEADGSGARAVHVLCKGAAPAMRGGPALPWQPHRFRADLRWKGRTEDANNAPMQSDVLLHRIGLAN